MALRFIGALGIGALYMACNTLMAEYVPTLTVQRSWVHYRQVKP